MNKTRFEYIWALYILRGQGFHNGHLHNIVEALKISKYLIILLGSHNKAIDYDDPWTAEQRRDMIEASLTPEQKERIYFQYVEDRLYSNVMWQTMAQDAVDSILLQYSKYRLNATDKKRQVKMCIVGHNKDESSWYLSAFPNLDLVEISKYSIEKDDVPLSATMIRTAIYNNQFGYMKSLMPLGAYNWIIDNWINTEAAQYVKDWYDFDKKYEEQYLQLPHAVNFYTADSVVIQNGHILLIKRKGFPAKDCWAIPGGHVNSDETAADASIRELLEETNLHISKEKLNASLMFEKRFDHPARSKRCRLRSKKGRTISMAFCYVLTDKKLLDIKAGDDAQDAMWVPLSDIKKMRNVLMEDHADILEYCASRVI